jgi:hypothetical protein
MGTTTLCYPQKTSPSLSAGISIAGPLGVPE